MHGNAERQTSDITLRKITKVTDLDRTDNWRTGDVNAAAGWRMDVVTHVPADLLAHPAYDVKSSVVFGGVSCSIPKDFVAKPVAPPTSNQPGPTGKPTPGGQPTVPVKIPAGDNPAAIAPARTSTAPYLIGGAAVVVVAGGAAFAWRRKSAAAGTRD